MFGQQISAADLAVARPLTACNGSDASRRAIGAANFHPLSAGAYAPGHQADAAVSDAAFVCASHILFGFDASEA